MVAASSHPSREEVSQCLSRFLQEVAGIRAEQITDTATIDSQLQMESVAFVELQVAIEDEYDVQLDPIEIVELNEFGPIVDYVLACIKARP
jgi:acyl carrier protein